MSAGGITIQEVRITNFALSSIAVLVTCLRLLDRGISRRLWWDDAWAGVTMAFVLVFMTAVEVHVQPPDKHTQNVKIAAYYMCAQFFYAVCWAARLSILFTVIRLAVGRLRTILGYIAMTFGVTWLILFSQVWWVCEREPGWKIQPIPQCDLGTNVAIAQVITDVLCDFILICAPIHMIWGIRLTWVQKIRVTAIFSTTIITTGVSLSHAYAVLRKGGLDEALAAVIQGSVSLIVANLSVIIAFFARITTEDSTSHHHQSNAVTTKSQFQFAKSKTAHLNTFMSTGTIPTRLEEGIHVHTEVLKLGTENVAMHSLPSKESSHTDLSGIYGASDRASDSENDLKYEVNSLA